MLHGYVASMFMACVPPLWRRTMAPLLACWDERLASEEERLLLHGAWRPSSPMRKGALQ